MKFPLVTRSIKGFIQAALALAIFLFNLGPGGTRIVHAAPPVNDSFASAKLINSITYVDSLVVTEATPTNSIPNVNDPDNIICENGTRKAGYSTVWYTYTPGITESISLDTLGSNYDTFIAVWTGTIGSLSLVICNDDTFENQQSELFFTGTAGTTYYIEVAQFAGFVGDPSSPPASCDVQAGGCNLQFHAYITTTNVNIAGTVKGKYYIPPGGSLRRGYFNVDNGPARITSTNGALIIAALRVIWQEPGPRFSYSELMGLPREQLSTEYWFPWYNNLETGSMSQGIRIGNIDTTSHTVEVWIGGIKRDTIPLGGGASVRVNYAVDNGPVRVVCTTCNSLNADDRIITALRVIWQEPGVRTSYSEMMGLPREQLSTQYWFPWYNNLETGSMNQGFRIANIDTTSHTVEVWIGGIKRDTIPLVGGASVRVNYAVDNGPARVVCTTCNSLNADDRIITALRVIWQEPGYRTSYSEMMGLPNEQLSIQYWFPWYNSATPSMLQAFRFGVP